MCETFMFIVILCSDVFDLVMDWVFYGEIKNAEDGLVFGPHDEILVKSTLAFCIIGTVTFTTEFFINCLECKWQVPDDEYRHSDKHEIISRISEVMTMTTLIIEDLPQIVINFTVAMCREDVTNIVQIVKAASALVEVIILVIVMSVKHCQAKRQVREIWEGKMKTWRKCIFGITIFLSIVILAFSSAVFALETNFNKEKIEFDSHGLDGKEADRYLQGVDVYMKSSTIPNMANYQWVNITDIKTVTRFPDQSENIVVRVLADQQYAWVKKPTTFRNSVMCYQATRVSMSPLPSTKCQEILSNITDGTYITVKLEYVRPNRHQPLGDILYNYVITDQNCEPISSPGTDVVFKYFKRNSHKTLGNFFTHTSDLGDIKDVWKTGRGNCTSTAREHPKRSTEIKVPCVPKNYLQ